MVESVKSFRQKEFNKVTKLHFSSDPSECDVLVEYISRIRCSVKVHKCFKIGGVQSETNGPESSERPTDPAFERWSNLAVSSKRPDADKTHQARNNEGNCPMR